MLKQEPKRKKSGFYKGKDGKILKSTNLNDRNESSQNKRLE